MPNRTELTDGEWQTIYSLLPLNQRVYVGWISRKPPALPQRRTLAIAQWHTVAVIACFTGQMELSVQTVFKVVQTGCMAKPT